VTVKNLPCAALMAGAAMPVRGAYVYGGGGAAMTNSAGVFSLNVDAGAGDTIIIRVCAATSDPAATPAPEYEAVQPDGATVYKYATGYTLATGANTENIVIDPTAPVDGAPTVATAEAFAIFSVAETYYVYAQALTATLPPFTITFPAAETQTVAGNMSFAANDPFGPTNPVSQPTSTGCVFGALVGHEFGHVVAYNTGFAASPAVPAEVDPYGHQMWANERAMRHVPDVSTEPIYMDGYDQQIGFAEGFADYYAAAAAAHEGSGPGSLAPTVPSMASLAQGKLPWSPSKISVLGGLGEDNESSVMRILWQLADNPSLAAFVPGPYDGPTNLFAEMLQGSGINTLDALWHKLVPDTTTSAGAQAAALLGGTFEAAHVSPTIPSAAVDQNNKTFTFIVPNLCAPGAGPPGTWIDQPTTDQAQILVYYDSNGSWVPAAPAITLNLESPGDGLVPIHSPENPDSTEFQYTVGAAIWAQINNPAHGALRYWVVTAGATVAGGGVSGQYWSHAETFRVAGMIPQQFRAGIITNGVTSNDPQLVYDIVGTTIPGFTVTVYASPTGLFDDGTEAPAGYYYVGDPGSAPPLPNLCVIDADDAGYLTATSSDYERTITLPASALDPNVLAADPDGYLLAKIHFDGDTTDADDIWVRFEGGAFQTTGGAVWAYASASLDDVTPDSNNPDTIEVAATQSGVTVSDVGGAEWDPVSYNEAFTSVWGNTTVFAHEGNNAITATSAGCPSGVDIQAGDGGNTIDGTGMDWLGGLYVQAGNGDNTVLGGAGTVDVSAGDGDNVVRCTSGNYSGSWVALGDGDNTVYGGPYDDTIILGNGDSTVYLGVADTLELGCGNDAVQFGTGDNTFIVDAAVAGTTGIHPATGIVPGENTLELAYTATSPPPDLSGLTLPSGSMQLPTGSDLSYSGIAQLGLDFEGGGTVGMPAVPPGTNVTVGSGTTLDMAGNTTPLGAVTLEDGTLNLGGTTQTVAALTLAGGSVVDGTISADAYNLHSGTLSASLGGDGGVTVGSGATGTVTLSGANSYGGRAKGMWCGRPHDGIAAGGGATTAPAGAGR
jgi:hypothetical protein